MKKKPIPEFMNEAEERAFWAAHDSAEYVGWSKAPQVSMPHKVGQRHVYILGPTGPRR